jgi:hypothetical protein
VAPTTKSQLNEPGKSFYSNIQETKKMFSNHWITTTFGAMNYNTPRNLAFVRREVKANSLLKLLLQTWILGPIPLKTKSFRAPRSSSNIQEEFRVQLISEKEYDFMKQGMSWDVQA